MLKLSKIPRNFVIVENGLEINIFSAGNFLVRIIKTLGLPCDVDLFLQRFRKKAKKKVLFSTYCNMEFSLLSESDSYLFYYTCIYFLSEFRYVLEAYRCNTRLEFTQVINFYLYVSQDLCFVFMRKAFEWQNPT